MKAQDKARIERLRQLTSIRVGLKEWETITNFHELPEAVMVTIDTYDVRVLVREDRYERHGLRFLIIAKSVPNNNWYIDNDMTAWDDSFQPYIYEKIGRRRTADELLAQREWEQMCHRPGTSKNPLDSYERVLDGMYSDNEKGMEGYY